MKGFSQYNQDLFLYNEFFKDKVDGFFVEVGADDGIDKSNTYFFEQLGWKGICIEPSPVRYKFLQENRKCLSINNAISSKKGEFEFIDIIGYGKGLSGLVQKYDPKHLERIKRETDDNPNTISKEIIKVEALPLSEIFSLNKVQLVDYCSIDVEGGEVSVLESIDFNNVEIKVFSIEDPYSSDELRNLLKRINYKVIKKMGPDLICVPKKKILGFYY